MLPHTLWFLEASDKTPLTKTINTAHIEPYPYIKYFTSHTETALSLDHFYQLIEDHARLDRCLVKGDLKAPLIKASRAGSTDPHQPSTWGVLDFDGVTASSPEDVLKELGLSDLDCIIQYSCSQGFKTNKSLSFHVFFEFDQPYTPELQKLWLQWVNLTNPWLQDQIQLTRSYTALHYPLDITLAQNDKLIYIAPPVLLDGLTDPLAQRIWRHPGELLAVSIDERAMRAAQTSKAALGIYNTLRDQQNLPRRKSFRLTLAPDGKTKVLKDPGKAQVTGIFEARGFVYLNINGGDSKGYFHPSTDVSVIYNFKGEPNYLTREFLPEYYHDYVNKVPPPPASVPGGSKNTHGIAYLHFIEKNSNVYYRGTFDYSTNKLDLRHAPSKGIVTNFLKLHGQPLPDCIQEWTYNFDYSKDIVFDPKNRFANRYVRSDYLSRPPSSTVRQIPVHIKKLIDHVLDYDGESIERFINWLAYIIQLRTPTKTAWLITGTQGTGKGLLVNNIIRPIIGSNYVNSITMDRVAVRFNEYMEDCVILNVDEIHITHKSQHEIMRQKIKPMITEDLIFIDPKGIRPYTVKSWVNVIFTSNERDALMIVQDDRRVNVSPYQEYKIPIDTNFVPSLKKELPEFTAFLLDYSVDTVQATSVVFNDAKRLNVQMSNSPFDEALTELKHGNWEFFAEEAWINTTLDPAVLTIGQSTSLTILRTLLHEALQSMIEGNPQQKIPRNVLHQALRAILPWVSETPVQFAKQLVRAGITIQPQWDDRTKTALRGVCIDWQLPTLNKAAVWERRIKENLTSMDVLREIRK